MIKFSDETTAGVVLDVLEGIYAFCANNDNCEGCPFMIKPAPGKSFATCALFGRPEYWRVDIWGGENNERQ